MNLRNELESRYPTDFALQNLGTLEVLREYLNEELREMQRQGVLLEACAASDKNPNNILAYYLARVAPLPTELYHKWDEGDYPDIDCLASWTKIKANGNDVAIESVAVGDTAVDAFGDAQTVLSVRFRKLRPGERAYELKWDDGSITTISEKHILMIDGQEMMAKEIAERASADREK